MKILANLFVLVTFLFFFAGNVFAGFTCIDDPTTTATPPEKKCIESGGTSTLRECLIGVVGKRFCVPTECDPPRYVDVLGTPCKTDPRYQLRNFAPMLNFPTIGSMLNLATGVVGTVAGILCGISMFYGAYRYLSAAGEEKKLESARSRMIYSVIGLVIVILAYSIVKIILDVTSTNTVGF